MNERRGGEKGRRYTLRQPRGGKVVAVGGYQSATSMASTKVRREKGKGEGGGGEEKERREEREEVERVAWLVAAGIRQWPKGEKGGRGWCTERRERKVKEREGEVRKRERERVAGEGRRRGGSIG